MNIRNWFKKPSIAPETPKPKPEPEPEPEIDDWKPDHSDWGSVTVCHCGKLVEFKPIGNVCPKCGHDDKWETYVARYEWEFSPSRYKRFCSGFFDLVSSRNKHLVRWTEEHCKVGDWMEIQWWNEETDETEPISAQEAINRLRREIMLIGRWSLKTKRSMKAQGLKVCEHTIDEECELCKNALSEIKV